jgi:hypothetical protein
MGRRREKASRGKIEYLSGPKRKIPFKNFKISTRYGSSAGVFSWIN